MILINWKETPATHLKLKKPYRCIGHERALVANQLMALGSSNVNQDYQLNNFLKDGILTILIKKIKFIN